MNLGFLTLQPPPIPAHAIAALAALVLGGVQLAAPKGTISHRVLGYLWAALMMLVAISSLWIHELRIWGPWSYIHILSVLTIVTVPLAVWYAHSHNVNAHRSAMTKLYLFALVVAGLFTLVPGRVMHTVVFGS